MAPTIQNVSKERIRVEITKLLLSGQPEKLKLAEDTGLCEYFFPEFRKMLQTTQENPHHTFSVGEHAMKAVKHVQELYREMEKEEMRTSIFSPFDKAFGR